MAEIVETYLFYDIETTGLNVCFDQIIEFAAIRTRLDFSELARIEFKIKLNTDTVFSASAMLTHGHSPSDLEAGLNEYEAAQLIHQWMNEPGTISLGYNTLRFDDLFLRFLFYKNLLPPYSHQSQPCRRMDILPMLTAYHIFKPELLNWPVINGKVSLKLEHLNAANDLYSGQAHHALVDVEITLALARRMAHETQMWQRASAWFDKNHESRPLNLAKGTISVMINNRFGARNAMQKCVLLIGTHSKYKYTVWLDLEQVNLSELPGSPDGISSLKVIRRKPGIPDIFFPLSASHESKLPSDNVALARHNFEWLRGRTDLLLAIQQSHCTELYPKNDSIDDDAKLYSGFPDEAEKRAAWAFHQKEPAAKAASLDRLPLSIKPRAIRILGRHFPGTLKDSHLASFEAYLEAVRGAGPTLLDYEGQARLTPQETLAEIAQLQEQLGEPRDQIRLKSFEAYLTDHFCLETEQV